MQKYLTIEHNEYGTFTMSFSYTMLSVIPSIYVHVVRAAHLPVNNVMLSFIIVHTLLPTCSLGTLESCIMELNVVVRALVDGLVLDIKSSDKLFHFEDIEVDEQARTTGFGQ